jgi:hypothetical protein
LKVNAFSAGVRRDQHLEIAVKEATLKLVSGLVVDRPFKCLDAVAGFGEPVCKPAGRVRELGKNEELSRPRLNPVARRQARRGYPFRRRAPVLDRGSELGEHGLDRCDFTSFILGYCTDYHLLGPREIFRVLKPVRQ